MVFYGPDKRSHTSLVKRLGFDISTQVQDPLFDMVGNTGTAALPMMLVAVPEEAERGDLMLVYPEGEVAGQYGWRAEVLRAPPGGQRPEDAV